MSVITTSIGIDNCYVPLGLLKRHVNISSSTFDTRLLECIAAASRHFESPEMANRVFWTRADVRYFDGRWCDLLLVDDLLAITELAEDTGEDGSFATVWAATDYTLRPYNGWPKFEIAPAMGGEYLFTRGQRRYRVTGTFGYGDGKSASPWMATALTATVATTSATTVTVSAATNLDAGQTLLVESEQMFVTGYDATTITVVRGVNGTTAAAHSGKAISIAQYPGAVVRAVAWLAARAWNTDAEAGIEFQMVGDWQERYRMVADQYVLNLANSVRRVA